MGIYLSAHPLDEYKIVLEALCNTKCQELADISALAEKSDVTIGGIVTGVKSKFTKTGKPCGFVTVEDFEGSGEIALFGEEWGRWNGMFTEGCSVYITAKCQPRYRDSNLYDLKISNIEYLQSIKDRAITKITISLDTEGFDSQMLQELNQIVIANPGKTKLYFQLRDPSNKSQVLMYSTKYAVDVRRELIAFLESSPFSDYRIN